MEWHGSQSDDMEDVSFDSSDASLTDKSAYEGSSDEEGTTLSEQSSPQRTHSETRLTSSSDSMSMDSSRETDSLLNRRSRTDRSTTSRKLGSTHSPSPKVSSPTPSSSGDTKSTGSWSNGQSTSSTLSSLIRSSDGFSPIPSSMDHRPSSNKMRRLSKLKDILHGVMSRTGGTGEDRQ